jgi:hypothetical protein
VCWGAWVVVGSFTSWTFESFQCSLGSFEPHDVAASSWAKTTVISVDYLHVRLFLLICWRNWLNKLCVAPKFETSWCCSCYILYADVGSPVGTWDRRQFLVVSSCRGLTLTPAQCSRSGCKPNWLDWLASHAFSRVGYYFNHFTLQNEKKKPKSFSHNTIWLERTRKGTEWKYMICIYTYVSDFDVNN